MGNKMNNRTPEQEIQWQAAKKKITAQFIIGKYSHEIVDDILALPEIEIRDINQTCEVSHFPSETRRLIHQNNLVRVLPK